jgi:hypothetical protein
MRMPVAGVRMKINPGKYPLEFSTKKVEGLNFISHHLKRQ